MTAAGEAIDATGAVDGEGEETPRLFSLMQIVGILISPGLFALVVRAAATGRFFRGRHAPPAMLTAFHDRSPRDRQAAVEQNIEQNAGTQQKAQETGEGEKKGSSGK